MTIQWRTILKFGMANVNFIEEKKKRKKPTSNKPSWINQYTHVALRGREWHAALSTKNFPYSVRPLYPNKQNK